MKAVKDPKCITGTIKPAKLKPLYVKGIIFTLGKSTVSIYRSIVLIKNENNPRVIIFRGSENTVNIGLKTLKSMASKSPAKRYVIIFPVITTPPRKIEVK